MSVLTIPASTVSHTLPTPFSFLAHGPNSGGTDISDTTYVALVKALGPDGWRFYAWDPAQGFAPPGTPSATVTPMWGQAGSWADVHFSETPTPYLYFTMNAGPANRPSTIRGDTPNNFGVGSTAEGSPQALQDWAAWLYSKYGVYLFMLDMENEPSNNVRNPPAGKPTGQALWYDATTFGIADYSAESWPPTNIRSYKSVITSAKVGFPSWADSGMENGYNSHIDNSIGGTGGAIGSNWPWGNNNIQAAAYDIFNQHAYSNVNNTAFDKAMNSAFHPLVSAAINPGSGPDYMGYLAAFDLIRGYLNTAGGTNIPMGVTEWESASLWGRAGQGAVADAGFAIITANRQKAWKSWGFTWMDVQRDAQTQAGGVGDQIIGYSGIGVWTPLPRYFGFKNFIIPFLRNYPKIITVPMYSGDTADCTWSTPPGNTANASPTLAIQRHQAAVGYNVATNKLGILIIDCAIPGASSEQCTINLPMTIPSTTVTYQYMDPWEGYVGLNPANAYTPSGTFASPSTTTLSGSSISTGTGIATLKPSSMLFIEIPLPGGSPPPSSSGLLSLLRIGR